jgi:hypothetical protein
MLSRHRRAATLVAAVVVAGSVVRIIGLHHGQGRILFHPDVRKQALVVREIRRGNLKISRLFKRDYQLTGYPYGAAHLTGRVIRWLSPGKEIRKRLLEQSLWKWAVYLRYFSVATIMAAFAVAGVALAKELGWAAAVLTSFLLVLEPLNVQYSHYGMNDVPLVAALLLAWLCSGGMHRESARLPLFSFFCGFCLGLGTGIKYQAVLGAVLAAVPWLACLRSKGWRWAVASALALLLGAAAGMACTMYLLMTEPDHFFEAVPKFMAWQSHILTVDEPLFAHARDGMLPRNALWLARLFLARGLWVLLPGALWALHRVLPGKKDEPHHVRGMVMSALLFCLVMAATLVISREKMRENDALTIIPFLTVISGLMLSRLLRARHSFPARVAATAALPAMTVLLVVFGVTSVMDSLALSRTDTRRLAREWCRANLPIGSKVVSEYYTLPVRKEGVTDIKTIYLCTGRGQEKILAGEADYLVASSLSHSRFFDRLSPYFDLDFQVWYEDLGERHERVAVFRDRELLYAQPVVTVYARRSPERAKE